MNFLAQNKFILILPLFFVYCQLAQANQSGQVDGSLDDVDAITGATDADADADGDGDGDGDSDGDEDSSEESSDDDDDSEDQSSDEKKTTESDTACHTMATIGSPQGPSLFSFGLLSEVL